MIVARIANSKNDEFYTPAYAIYPIIKYLKLKGYKKIYCPFDTNKSLFVRELFLNGFDVTSSHIEDGIDFFEIDFSDYDCIVSNPPYSIKGKVLEHLFEIGVPFAMLVGVVGLFESEKRFTMFENNEFEVLYLNRRVAYFKDYEEQKPSLNPPFSSIYICSKVLPKQICFERIKK